MPKPSSNGTKVKRNSSTKKTKKKTSSFTASTASNSPGYKNNTTTSTTNYDSDGDDNSAIYPTMSSMSNSVNSKNNNNNNNSYAPSSEEESDRGWSDDSGRESDRDLLETLQRTTKKKQKTPVAKAGRKSLPPVTESPPIQGKVLGSSSSNDNIPDFDDLDQHEESDDEALFNSSSALNSSSGNLMYNNGNNSGSNALPPAPDPKSQFKSGPPSPGTEERGKLSLRNITGTPAAAKATTPVQSPPMSSSSSGSSSGSSSHSSASRNSFANEQPHSPNSSQGEDDSNNQILGPSPVFDQRNYNAAPVILPAAPNLNQQPEQAECINDRQVPNIVDVEATYGHYKQDQPQYDHDGRLMDPSGELAEEDTYYDRHGELAPLPPQAVNNDQYSDDYDGDDPYDDRGRYNGYPEEQGDNYQDNRSYADDQQPAQPYDYYGPDETDISQRGRHLVQGKYSDHDDPESPRSEVKVITPHDLSSFAETRRRERRLTFWLVLCLIISLVALAALAGGIVGALYLGRDDDDNEDVDAVGVVDNSVDSTDTPSTLATSPPTESPVVDSDTPVIPVVVITQAPTAAPLATESPTPEPVDVLIETLEPVVEATPVPTVAPTTPPAETNPPTSILTSSPTVTSTVAVTTLAPTTAVTVAATTLAPTAAVTVAVTTLAPTAGVAVACGGFGQPACP